MITHKYSFICIMAFTTTCLLASERLTEIHSATMQHEYDNIAQHVSEISTALQKHFQTQDSTEDIYAALTTIDDHLLEQQTTPLIIKGLDKECDVFNHKINDFIEQ